MTHSTSPLERLPRGAGVALIRLRSLGDTVLMTPALAALKAWRPDLRLTALVEPRWAGALAGNPDLERVIEVPAGLAPRFRALQQLRRFRPELTIGLHGGSTAAWLARVSGAPQRAHFSGLRHAWAYNLQTQPFMPTDGRDRLHSAEHPVSLFWALGLPRTEVGPLRVFVQPAAADALRRRLAAAGVSGPYVYFNVDAREPGMRWPPERFAELAAWLRREFGWSAVSASAGTPAAVPSVTALSGTSVPELIALVAGAKIVVGNDGGPIHIAAAFGRSVVALYSTTDVPLWSPWRTPARVLQADPIGAIQVEAVRAAVAGLPV